MSKRKPKTETEKVVTNQHGGDWKQTAKRQASKSSYERGQDACNNGLPIANPYGDTARGEEWVEGYEHGASDFRARIDGICNYVRSAFRQMRIDEGDAHLTICTKTADDFSLWQSDDSEPNKEYFPLWLSFIVQGIGREEFKLS